MTGARRFATITGAALLCLLGAESVRSADPSPLTDEQLIVTCGPPPPGHRIRGKRDYRQRNASILNQRDYTAHEWAHIRPARARINSGKNLDWDVMNNLDFVLSKVPNNEQALRLLVEWDLMGGRHYENVYAAPACYLIWAAQFAPDDVVVWNYGGYYFHRKGDMRRALLWWGEALTVDPSNAEVHNSLGLVAFENGDYETARSHAWAAYAAGFPLPTLRDKLKAAGEWKDPPPTTVTGGP